MYLRRFSRAGGKPASIFSAVISSSKRLDRLIRKPDRQAAAPAQALVVIAPVRDLALLLRDVVASVLVQLEGQGGHPGSDGGPPCYLDRAPGATPGILATT